MARPCLLPFFLLAAAAVLTSAPSGALAKSKLAKKSDDIVNGPLLTEKIKAKRTLIVGPDEEYKTVQSAIDAVPAGNTEWIIVHLRSGVHRHACCFPISPISFSFCFQEERGMGNGKGRTSISHESASADNAESAAFTVNADNVIVFGVSFRNSARSGLVNNPEIRSVSAMVAGDKVAFYHCAFYSPHHTLFDSTGRHYYESCYIQGNIDFIFGGGQSMFQCPEIFVKPDRRTAILGSITAQDRKAEDDASGFVFLKGKVYGVGEVYLGRVNAPDSRVIFADTYLSKTINPAGWTRIGYTGSTEKVMLAEVNCTGPGSDAAKRVPWSRRFTVNEASKYLTVDFINGKEWLPAFYY
ncbi:putative pectinesterase 67 [Dichanthelium oligosanthes]|uniref:pectinesterase n=1 Tax=Dichanthelium oligosanthes TaxID=888268 RepID=A0A1E5UZB6_9POAL|nr:putative pectinesterase 67 [Dichanthelium oligosanthes]